MKYAIRNPKREFTDPALLVTAELWRVDPVGGDTLVREFSIQLDARANNRQVVFRVLQGEAVRIAHEDKARLYGGMQTEDAIRDLEVDV